MRAVVQRVTDADVTTAGKVTEALKKVLLCFSASRTATKKRI